MNNKTALLLGIIIALAIILVLIGLTKHKIELAYNNGYSDGYAYALEKYEIKE